MYPGLSEMDFEVVMLHHRALVAEGRHQQAIRGLRPIPVGPRAVAAMVRRQIGLILTQVGSCFQGAHAATSNGRGPVTSRERGAELLHA